MKIRKMGNKSGRWFRIDMNKHELEEFKQGLATSCDRSTFLYGDGLAQKMYNQIDELEK